MRDDITDERLENVTINLGCLIETRFKIQNVKISKPTTRCLKSEIVTLNYYHLHKIFHIYFPIDEFNFVMFKSLSNSKKENSVIASRNSNWNLRISRRRGRLPAKAAPGKPSSPTSELYSRSRSGHQTNTNLVPNESKIKNVFVSSIDQTIVYINKRNRMWL